MLNILIIEHIGFKKMKTSSTILIFFDAYIRGLSAGDKILDSEMNYDKKMTDPAC